MKSLILVATVHSVTQVAARENYKAQEKVLCSHGISFFINQDAPGAGRFDYGYELTISCESYSGNKATVNGKEREFLNLRGVKILKIEAPVKTEDNSFADLPILQRKQPQANPNSAMNAPPKI